MKQDNDITVMLTIHAGMTAARMAAVLRGVADTWRLVGMGDGSIVVGPRRLEAVQADAEDRDPLHRAEIDEQ